jgi:hypothetical protein
MYAINDERARTTTLRCGLRDAGLLTILFVGDMLDPDGGITLIVDLEHRKESHEAVRGQCHANAPRGA